MTALTLAMLCIFMLSFAVQFTGLVFELRQPTLAGVLITAVSGLAFVVLVRRHDDAR